MLAELSITPIGEGEHLAGPVSLAIDLIAASGLTYQVTAMGTLIEGPDDRVWELLRRCHEAVRGRSARLVTEIRLDDAGRSGQALDRSVRRVEEELQRPVARTP